MDVVAVLPYAKARALVWGTVTLGIGLAFAGPLVAISVWGDKPLRVALGDFWRAVGHIHGPVGA